MSPDYSRRDALGLCGAALSLGTAGCFGTSPNGTGSRETDAPTGASSRSATNSTATTDARSATDRR